MIRDTDAAGKDKLKIYVDLCFKVERCREEMVVLPREARDAIEYFANRKTALSAAIVELSGEPDNSVGGGRRLLLRQEQHRMAALETRMRAAYQELCTLSGVAYVPVPETEVFTAQGDSTRCR